MIVKIITKALLLEIYFAILLGILLNLIIKLCALTNKFTHMGNLTIS